MAVSKDLLHQNFLTAQGDLQPKPNTVASAATIVPTTLITFITGTAQVANITPPLDGQHMLVLIYTNAAPGTFLTTGNVANAIVPTQNLPTILFYDPNTKKYYGFASNLT